ncbi:MAG: GH3 auxin-responsive promoter family protein [Chloroflexi bacterium]|nr:GH3 auxin-responsive promoter family protein [Chloroflexota bacterium]
MHQRTLFAQTPYPELDWDRYCGFLELETEEFSGIQDKLLLEQIQLLRTSQLVERFLPRANITTVEEFREKVPLTTYEDYSDVLKPGSDRMLPVAPYSWAYTTYGAGKSKWIPYTRGAFEQFLDNIMASLLIAAADEPGHVNVHAGDVVMYNVPPRPYLCGLAAPGMKEKFGLVGVLDPVVAEKLEFKDRIAAAFKEALKTRVDLIISMTSILLKTGERLEGHASDAGAGRNRSDLNRRALGRIARARLKSALKRRPIRPRDLWHPKGIVGWGLDTSFSRDKVAEYWGSLPYEIYASTEGGVMGVQPVDGRGILFNPRADFFELIPEADLNSVDQPSDSIPRTLLPSEAEPGGTYEVVITNFYGMPLVRYRTGNLIRFMPGAATTRTHQPRFEVIGRSDQRIDIAGFTRIDEKTVWEALRLADTPFTDWAMTSERTEDGTILHIYGEPRANSDLAGVSDRIHEAMRRVDPLYRDLESMLDIRPLRSTVLPAGSFSRYYERKRAAGAPLTDRRPASMNADASVIADLKSAAREVEELAA